MAKRIIIDTPEDDTPRPEDQLVGLVDPSPAYKVCHKVNKTLGIDLVSSHLFGTELPNPNASSAASAKLELEYHRWQFEAKQQAIYLIPNIQEYEIDAPAEPAKGTLFDTLEPPAALRRITMLPGWRVDYILRFEGLDAEAIAEAAAKLRASGCFTMVAAADARALRNSALLYMLR